MEKIIQNFLADGKGILAADESNKTAGKRLDAIGLENTEENRRAFRDLFLSTEGIENYLSGVILYDETIRQTNPNGTLFTDALKEKGIEIGIKVDMSTTPLPGFPEEVMTQGLDGLGERLSEYKDMGATFTKWRAVFRIGEGIPTKECIHANALDMARYVAFVQEAGMGPIVEPEVLLDGDHTIEESAETIEEAVSHTFYEIKRMRGDISKTILKTSMALPGSKNEKAKPEEVAKSTLSALLASVPKEVPGVVFLSGGQTSEEASLNLATIVSEGKRVGAPWKLTFSFARALQEEPLSTWGGKLENVETARKVLEDVLVRNTKAIS